MPAKCPADGMKFPQREEDLLYKDATCLCCSLTLWVSLLSGHVQLLRLFWMLLFESFSTLFCLALFFLALRKAPFPFGCFLLGLLFFIHPLRDTPVVPPCATAAERAALPILPVCAVLSCVQIMQVYRIFNTRKDIDDYDCTRGLYEHRKRVCTESWPTVGENSHATPAYWTTSVVSSAPGFRFDALPLPKLRFPCDLFLA